MIGWNNSRELDPRPVGVHPSFSPSPYELAGAGEGVWESVPLQRFAAEGGAQ